MASFRPCCAQANRNRHTAAWAWRGPRVVMPSDPATIFQRLAHVSHQGGRAAQLSPGTLEGPS